jgi:hypothetical protein
MPLDVRLSLRAISGNLHTESNQSPTEWLYSGKIAILRPVKFFIEQKYCVLYEITCIQTETVRVYRRMNIVKY